MAKITTITNPLTGQPAQVDQLDHTAQQIDDAIARALPGGAIDSVLSSKPNPNLLDNWYFGNPVDQRGGYVVPPDTSYYANDTGALVGTTDKYYTVGSRVSDKAYFAKDGAVYNVPISAVVRGYTGAGYTIDRWKFDSAAPLPVVIESTGIKIINGNGASHGIIQFFENDILGGKQVTYSMLYKGDGCGIWSYGQNQYFPASADWSLVSMTFIAPTGTDSSQWYASIAPAAFSTTQIKAAKLELGTEQTLAHQDENGNWVLNEIPDFGEQLRRCQRYYIDGSGLKFYSVAKTVELGGTYKFMIPVTFPVTMRETPSVSVNVAWSYGDPTEVYASDVTKGSTTIIVAASSEKVVGVTVEITAIANL